MLGPRRRPAAEAVRQTEMAVVGALWEGLAAEWASHAPKSYPDGSPYLAEQHLANLAHVATAVTSLQWPETNAVVGDIAILMAMVRDAHEEGPHLEAMQALAETCSALVRHDLVREAGFVVAVGVDVNRYYEQSAQN